MSVINKMLRDLDARRSGSAGPAVMQGTASVHGPTASGPSLRRWLSWVLLLLLLVMACVWAWRWQAGGTVTPVVPPPAPVALTVPAPEPVASAPVETASAAISPPVEAPAVAAAAQEPAPGAERRRKRKESAADVQPSPRAADTARERRKPVAAASAPQEEPVAPRRAALPVQAASASAATENGASAGQRRQAAALETLAQAQGLWNAGSREAGLDLLRDAVVAVERSQPVDAALLAQLVREQVRMELALGRPGAVLTVLARLESPLAAYADLWALRGNAAQRLGRHEEAVQAYLSALQLRAGEPRWMLGAAVSLAALGRLEAAAQQAEQARALGPVNPEVLAYLRQAGVPLR